MSNKTVYLLMISLMIGSVACNRTSVNRSNNTVDVVSSAIKDPVDPPVASTQGFFLDDWQPKTYVAPQYTDEVAPANPTATVTIDMANVITKIPTAIFGQNANIWMSKMIDQPAFITHLTHLNPHILRWPAGSGSDVYFWNCANQPPADAPKRLMKSDGAFQTDNLYSYGKINNNWQGSVDDYYAVLKKTNSVGLITVNYGYARYGTSANPVAAAAHLAADWVRYDKGRSKYWEVGNENSGFWEWGFRIDKSANKDGQPEYLNGKLYAQHFKVFADSMRTAAAQIGTTIYIGAVMNEQTPQWTDSANTAQTWNSTMIPEIKDTPDFYVVHHYFTPDRQNSSATVILNAALTAPRQMINYVTDQFAQYAPVPTQPAMKPVILSEWNMAAVDSMQMVSNVSGTFAVIVQCEAMKNHFGLTARWDLYNGWGGGNDMGLFSDGSAGAGEGKWNPRPSFYYMYFLQKCFGDRMVDASVTGSYTVKAYASSYTSGQSGLVLANTSGIPQTVQIKYNNFNMGDRFYWYALAGGNDNGSFSRKVYVNGDGTEAIAGGPSDYATLKAKSALTADGIRVTVPAWSAVFVMVDKK